MIANNIFIKKCVIISVTGSKGNRWSQITIRMGEYFLFDNFGDLFTVSYYCLALAVYSRSPAAYQALRSFKLLQLPCVRTLKYYIDANLESAGDSVERLQRSREQYVALIEEKKKILEENNDKGWNKVSNLMSHITTVLNYRFTIPSHFANWRRFIDYR